MAYFLLFICNKKEHLINYKYFSGKYPSVFRFYTELKVSVQIKSENNLVIVVQSYIQRMSTQIKKYVYES